ncbi:MAG: pyridoxamine 5'-phosphate oxidase family protein [Chloroflexi bacterium]|nr:pyridoxamine 5'-phosphate oxidase family protein [Chloroflexota bacterium]
MNAPIENPQSKIQNFLAAHSTLALSTVNADGQPQSAPLFFAVDDDGSLLFVSSPKSRHSLNIAVNSQAAVTVHNEAWTWQEIAGVQMEGRVHHLPAGPGREHAWEVYKARFPFVVEFEDEVSRSEFYRFTPKWIRLIDNKVRFGFKEEIELP